MQNLLDKLNYKDQRRIAILNSEENFFNIISKLLKDVIIDKAIDPRCPYELILIFVKTVSEVEFFAPVALHNLIADGILWFCYHKKSSGKYNVELDREHGWEVLNRSGFYGIRMVSVDDEWSAFRFRNIKYIKSTSKRFTK
jgi:hypothetical protein